MSFAMPVTVYIEDTDAGGIVYYVNYLKYMERARSEWLRASGLTQRELFDDGVQLVVHRLTCRYAKPARLDDRLQVTASVVEATSCRVRFISRYWRAGNPCATRTSILRVSTRRGFAPRAGRRPWPRP